MAQLSIRTSLVVPRSLGSGSLGDGGGGVKALGSSGVVVEAGGVRTFKLSVLRPCTLCQTKGLTDAVGGRSGVEVEAGRVNCSVRQRTAQPVHQYRWARPPAGKGATWTVRIEVAGYQDVAKDGK